MKQLIIKLIYFFSITQTIKYLNSNSFMSDEWKSTLYSDKNKDWNR